MENMKHIILWNQKKDSLWQLRTCKYSLTVVLWLQKPPKNKIIHRIQRIAIQHIA